MVQVLILAAVAAFLFWRLSIVLGVRTGFEKTLDIKIKTPDNNDNSGPETVNNKNHTSDDDISDYVDLDSEPGARLRKIKELEGSFSVQKFVSGAKNAYEIILMAYENGDLTTLQSHLANDVYEEFEATVTDRVNKGYKVDANFIGLREIRIRDVIFEDDSANAEITVFFKCELTSVVRDSNEIIVEGSSSKVKSHTDVWTFGRKIGTDDPSWKLVATGS
jgi:predicted lipid-binding transport protein (Tim44 family)